MGACGSSEDTNDTKPTKSDPTTPDKEETVTVTFDLNYTGATDTPSAQTIKKGSKAKVPTPQPTRAKYKLTNWYTDAATTKVFAFTNPITANITLYAGWQRSVYTVTFDVNGGTGTVAEQSIPKNGKATAPTTTDNPTRTGYTFDGWYENKDGSGTVFAFTTTLITADMTLYAGWTPVYTVTFDLGGGTGTAPNQTVKKGDNATAPTDPTRDGYKFVDWYTDAATTKVFNFTTPITKAITLYAGWQKIITYTVTFDGNYDGAAAPTTVTVAKDDKATEPTTDPTRDNYTFDNWYEKQDGTGTAFVFTTTPITADTILYAKWVKCPLRDARKALTHVVPLYKDGEADAPYLPKALRRASLVDEPTQNIFVSGPNIPTPPAGQENQLPYIRPDSHYPSRQENIRFITGGFRVTPDYIDASRLTEPDPDPNPSGDNTVRISCYSVKEISKDLYFYYGKVRFLIDGQETEGFNKTMYAWTGINKNDPANKDALYGYMVSIQGNYLRPLRQYPFVGGKYTRAASGTKGTADYVPEKIVTFPRTEEQYAALTLEDLKIIATAPLTSDKLFKGTFFPAGVKGIFGQ